MNLPKRIFVIGHMGAGKFLFTEALAKKLGWEIVDANPSVERYIGRFTREILGEQGEAAFNRCQAEIISHAMKNENIIVLLEECMVSSEECRKLLASECVLYLKVSIETQLGRMKYGRKSALPVKDMKTLLEQQHRERDQFYDQLATIVVDSEGSTENDTDIGRFLDIDINKAMQALTKL